MKLSSALSLLLLTFEPLTALSTRNLQDVLGMTNETIIEEPTPMLVMAVDANSSEAIPMLFDAFTVSNDTGFVKVPTYNDTVFVAQDFNFSWYPDEFIMFKGENGTEEGFVIPPHWRRGGGAMPDDNSTIVLMAPDGANYSDFVTFDNLTFSQDFPIYYMALPDLPPGGVFMAPPSGNESTGEELLPPGMVYDSPPFLVLASPPNSDNVTSVVANYTVSDVNKTEEMESENPPIVVKNETVTDTNKTQEMVSENPPAVVSNETTVVKPTLGGTPWFTLIKNLFPSPDFKACGRRRNIAPADGSKCSKKKDKICYFGNKPCPDILEFPEIRCKCGGPTSNRTWTCTPLACPA